MHIYKGKDKCACGKRANYRVIGNGYSHFACEEHKKWLTRLLSHEELTRIKLTKKPE